MRHGIAVLSAAAGTALAAPACGQVTYQTVALSGRPAPGTPAAVTYSLFGLPVLNDAGQVSFLARFDGNGVTPANDEALYTGAPSAPQLIARAGDSAPGTPANVRYSFLYDPALNDLGQVAYLAVLSVDGVASGNDAAIYAGTPSAPQLVARTGDPAPGTTAGVRYASLFLTTPLPLETPALNDVGQVAFPPVLTGSGVTGENDDALYAGDPATPHLPRGPVRVIAAGVDGDAAGSPDSSPTSRRLVRRRAPSLTGGSTEATSPWAPPARPFPPPSAPCSCPLQRRDGRGPHLRPTSLRSSRAS